MNTLITPTNVTELSPILSSSGKSSPAARLKVAGGWFTPTGELILKTAADGRLTGADPFTGQLRPPPSAAPPIWRGRRRSFDGSLVAELVHDGCHDHHYGDEYELNNAVLISRVDTGAEVSRYLHDDAVVDVAFLRDGRHAASAVACSEIAIWDLNTGAKTGAIPVPKRTTARPMRSSPRGDLTFCLADSTGSRKRKHPIRLHSFATGRHHDLTGHIGPITTLSFNPSGSLLASGGADGSLYLWSFDRNPPRRKPWKLIRGGDKIETVSFSPDGKLLLTHTLNGSFTVWAVEL